MNSLFKLLSHTSLSEPMCNTVFQYINYSAENLYKISKTNEYKQFYNIFGTNLTLLDIYVRLCKLGHNSIVFNKKDPGWSLVYLWLSVELDKYDIFEWEEKNNYFTVSLINKKEKDRISFSSLLIIMSVIDQME